MRSISVHGFAGGFDLGVARAGFDITARMSGPSGFGAPLVEANRHLLPGDWTTVADDPDRWPVIEAEMVFGNPPCSGFSSLSVLNDGYGIGSRANQGMYDLIDYAAKVRPLIAIFESVPGAGGHGERQGFDLMVQLRDRLEERSHLRYDLSLVYQDNASIGGASLRKRMFWVASRVKFGTEPPAWRHVPTLLETIGDLAGLPLSWTGSPDGHVIRDTTTTQQVRVLCEMAEANGRPWQGGEKVRDVVCRLGPGGMCHHCETSGLIGHETLGLDVSWLNRTNTVHGGGPHGTKRWKGNEPAMTIDGHAMERIVHPTLNRTMTLREIARIMGFPDDWTLLPARGRTEAVAWLGKGIPVKAGKWIAYWAARAIDRKPGWDEGRICGDPRDRVRVINNNSSKRSNGPTLFGVEPDLSALG